MFERILYQMFRFRISLNKAPELFFWKKVVLLSERVVKHFFESQLFNQQSDWEGRGRLISAYLRTLAGDGPLKRERL